MWCENEDSNELVSESEVNACQPCAKVVFRHSTCMLAATCNSSGVLPSGQGRLAVQCKAAMRVRMFRDEGADVSTAIDWPRHRSQLCAFRHMLWQVLV